MVKKISTTAVPKEHCRDYAGKAQQGFRVMQWCLQDREWDSVLLNGVHASINLSDAISVFQIGQRSTGKDHRDAISLLTQALPNNKMIKKNAARLLEILDCKNEVEYEPRRFKEKEAYTFVKKVERFFEWGLNILPNI